MEGIAIAFVFGLIYGSFLNVVILRFDDWLSLVNTPSHCPHCQHRLSWLDLIPVISYLTLRGRCRYCQKPISWQYPIVELSTAALLASGYYLIFLNSSLPLWQAVTSLIFFIIVIGSLMTIFFHDLYEMMIPDLMANIFIVSAILFSLVFHDNLLHSFYGFLVGIVPIALLVYPSRGTWMGEGDVKLSAGLGVMVGFPYAIVGLIAAFLIGGLFGALALGLKLVKLKSAVPFGPFLILGALIALFYGPTLASWYLGTIGYGYY